MKEDVGIRECARGIVRCWQSERATWGRIVKISNFEFL